MLLFYPGTRRVIGKRSIKRLKPKVCKKKISGSILHPLPSFLEDQLAPFRRPFASSIVDITKVMYVVY
jgi:hypothetical protein